MPQPATHYLIARGSIPEDHHKTWWDIYKPEFALGSSAPDLFYFPTIGKFMPQGVSVAADTPWGHWASRLHHEKSFDMFCSLLDQARDRRINGAGKDSNDKEVAKKQFAFAFGYYSHVIADCIFHPYVYRETKDHWCQSSLKAKIAHPAYESLIDTALLEYDYGKDKWGNISWKCDGETFYHLDYSLIVLLQKSLQDVYGNDFDFPQDINDQSHPIHVSYAILKETTATLFRDDVEVPVIGSFSSSIRRVLKPNNFLNEPLDVGNTLNAHTPHELFKIAKFAGQKVFNASLAFFENDHIDSSKLFFKDYPDKFLSSGNWNLDTGLSTECNTHHDIKNNTSSHFSYKSDEIRAQLTYYLEQVS